MAHGICQLSYSSHYCTDSDVWQDEIHRHRMDVPVRSEVPPHRALFLSFAPERQEVIGILGALLLSRPEDPREPMDSRSFFWGMTPHPPGMELLLEDSTEGRRTCCAARRAIPWMQRSKSGDAWA